MVEHRFFERQVQIAANWQHEIYFAFVLRFFFDGARAVARFYSTDIAKQDQPAMDPSRSPGRQRYDHDA
jgi:hypothetical protein